MVHSLVMFLPKQLTLLQEFLEKATQQFDVAD